MGRDVAEKERKAGETDAGGKGKEPRQVAQKPRTLEWIVGGVSAAVTLAMIGFLLLQALSGRQEIPRIEVTVERIRAIGGSHHVEFRAVNRGGATAAAVLVKGRLMDGQDVVEEREVTFDYMPAHSEQQGALFFQNDPGSYRLSLQPEGYKKP
ncbi:TIGR02588 family protein [Chelativorans sp. AA-79]|uniref:TIGR02588 family protein n=1 Tax=Chelativorans sp. AA-79 TaxID=3028735 RepID=UPI0023F838EA|nr:TIGR02588 family protein [Chelativorans sp. AA-79]WEX10632.1 TIGR02588 family protein [Chelativorans sp. AA-79]